MLINRTNVSVTPHASLQYTWLRTGSYTSKLNDLNAFHTESKLVQTRTDDRQILLKMH